MRVITSITPISIRDAISEYRSATRTLSQDTRRNSKQRLDLFASWCEEHSLTLDRLRASHIRDFLADVARRPGMKTEQVRASTVKTYTQTIKAFFHWCVQEDDYDVSAKVVDRVALPRVEQEVIEVFTPEQVAAMFEACEKMPYPVRDKALLSVLLDSGARASEIVTLTLDHVWLDPDDSHLLITGKGKKQRETPLGRTARLALRRYITRYRHPHVKGEQRVFLAGNTGVPITRSGLFQIVAKIGRKAHIKGVRCSPHTARHTMACMSLMNGTDLLKLSRLLGHSSIRTTETYLKAVTSKQARQGYISVLDSMKNL